VIPLRDYNPTRRRSLITWGLILINFGVYFYLAQNPVMNENAIAQYAVIPADITAGRHLGTLITSMFLHASLLHVGGNMLFLWIFGNNVEDKLGEIKFLVIYFAAGIAGSLLQVYITRRQPCRCWARAARSPASWRPMSSTSRGRAC
jgi:membrane associated rhomboid family serine protease